MNGLFIHLYLDEDVNVLIAKLLRARSFDATTTVEAGNIGNADEQQLAFAAAANMAVLTHNRVDFESLASEYLRLGKHQAGVIIAVRRPPHDIVRRLLVILDDVSTDDFRDQVRYI